MALAIVVAMKCKKNVTVQIDRKLGIDNEISLSKGEFLLKHIAKIMASRL